MEYLNKPIPNAESAYKTLKSSWQGLNKANFIDSGYLTDVNNISMAVLPYLETAPKASVLASGYGTPIVPLSIHGFGDFLIIVYRDGTNVKADYIKDGRKWTGTIKASATSADDIPRCIIQFNLYSTPSDPLSGTFVKKLIVYPDKLSFNYDMDMTAGVTTFTLASLDAAPNITPSLKYAAVYLSRVFGVDDARIYASGFNDYTMWDLDTADVQLASNAWVSTAQSNVKAGNDFIGITVFGGTVIAFKRDFMHEVYNNKNPFRVGDIYAEGTIDNRSVCDVDGNLIFVSSDDVKVYTGGNPKKIGTPLGLNGWTTGIAGTKGSTYYLYRKEGTINKIYTFNVDNGMWSAIDANTEIIGFASNEDGLYSLGLDGNIRKLDTVDYAQAWYLETDLTMASSLDPKRLKKLQMMVDIGTGANIKAYELSDNETFNVSTSQLLFDSGTKTGRQILRCGIRMTAGYGHKIRICGTGYVKLYTMELRYSLGGEKNA